MEQLEPTRNTYLVAFVGQEFLDDLPRCYWLFSKGSIKMLAGATVVQGLICCQVCVLGWQVSGGCWLEAPVAVHVNLPTGLLECPCPMAGFPHSSDSREHARSCSVCYDLA